MNTIVRRLPHVSPGKLRRLRRLLAFLQAISPALAARVALRLFLTPSRRQLNPADLPFVAQAREHVLPCGNGDSTHVYEWGTAPRTVLIVHGWGSHAPRFAPLASALVAAGWRVLALDAPAHGRSPGKTSSLLQFVHALDAVMKQLGPVQALIGHSLGALAIAVRLGGSDQLLPDTLRKIVLVSMPDGVPYLMASFEFMFDIRPATVRKIRELFGRRFRATPESFTALPGAASIRLPILLVHDRGDDIVPFEHSQQLLGQLQNARLHVTQGLGHSGLVRDADTIKVIESFLGSD